MTAKTFRRQITLTLLLLAATIAITLSVAAYLDPKADAGGVYIAAAIPLYIVFAAAWLSSLFQRRVAYTNALRALWERLVETIQDAVQYTHLSSASEKDFAVLMRALSCRVDDLRSVFRNVGEVYEEPTQAMKEFVRGVKHGRTADDYRALLERYGDDTKRGSGVYPYESLKQIQTAIGRLGHGARFNATDAAIVRTIINRLWGLLRSELLKELERDYPEFPDTPYR